jgi:acetyl-CoA carboxylase alpha subunit
MYAHLMPKALLILISGPYMSGTNGQEEAIAKNLKAMEDYALPIFQKGHIAVVGEWLA